jgi:hypothetical protein
MSEPEFGKLGSPTSPHGAIYVSRSIEGGIQVFTDIALETLKLNGIEITPEIKDEVYQIFQILQSECDKELFAQGIPEKLVKLLSFTKKSKLVAYCKRITITEDELVLLIHNCSQLGFSCNSKFPKYLPKKRQYSADEMDDLINREPAKFRKAVDSIFKERKNYMIHMFTRDNEWHCFYSTYHDLEDAGQRFKDGPHTHFVNHLWPEYTKKQVWKSFDQRTHKIRGVHIKLERFNYPDGPAPDPRMDLILTELVERYKNSS